VCAHVLGLCSAVWLRSVCRTLIYAVSPNYYFYYCRMERTRTARRAVHVRGAGVGWGERAGIPQPPPAVGHVVEACFEGGVKYTRARGLGGGTTTHTAQRLTWRLRRRATARVPPHAT
jgi:hypothetical protein